jgi:hypothetical protein
MIANFFQTSKPIHLVLVTFFAFGVFIFARINSVIESLSLTLIGKEIIMLIVVFLSILILAFFVSKNNLTLKNSYKVLFFVLFMGVLPATLENNEILFANLFILMALRRIFSLRTNTRIKKKLFDAAFWIMVAALFYFWAIVFFALIFIALLLFSNTQFKNWVIPFIGVLCAVILVLSYFSITGRSFEEIINFIQPVDFNFTNYNDINFIIGITVLISFALWGTIFYLKSFKNIPKQMISSHLLVLYLTLIASFIILIAPNKHGSEFIFLFAPFSIILSNYIQSNSERWFSEIFIWLLMLTPVVKFIV